MDLEVQTRQLALAPEHRELIHRRSTRLANRFSDLMRLHVTLRRGRHPRAGAEEAALVATVRGSTLRAEKRAPDLSAALHLAFKAMEVELTRYAEGRRDRSTPENRAQQSGHED